MAHLTESVVKDAALTWLEALGYAVLHWPDIAPGELAAERADYSQVVLERRRCCFSAAGPKFRPLRGPACTRRGTPTPWPITSRNPRALPMTLLTLSE